MIAGRAGLGEVLWNEVGVRETQSVQFMANAK